jgi:hypothetical protein
MFSLSSPPSSSPSTLRLMASCFGVGAMFGQAPNPPSRGRPAASRRPPLTSNVRRHQPKMSQGSSPTSAGAIAGILLLLGGGLAFALGVVVAVLGIAICLRATSCRAHAGALVLAQGLVMFFLGAGLLYVSASSASRRGNTHESRSAPRNQSFAGREARATLTPKRRA